MNLLTAMLLLVVIATWAGRPTTTMRSRHIDGSPAYEAGLRKGDEVLGIDGKKIDEWNDLLTVVGANEKRYGLL